jgi:hypothetical protein
MRKLRGEKAAFELSEYDLQVKFGHLALILTAYHGDERGITVAEDLFNNTEAAEKLGLPFSYGEEVQTINRIGPTGAWLRLGEAVRIGRRRLVEILDQQGAIDPARHELYNWRPFEAALRADKHISRDHLQVTSIGRGMAEVWDLGSTNGTRVEKVEITE